MTAPERIWPVGGYAPGKYWCQCSQCGGNFQGDKRAFKCHDCVIQSLLKKTSPEALAASPEVQDLIAAAVAEEKARGWKSAMALAEAAEARGMDRAAEIAESIRIRIANGPMPEGARFDYEQAIRAEAAAFRAIKKGE